MKDLLRVQPRFGGIHEKSETEEGCRMWNGKNFTVRIEDKKTLVVAQRFMEICGSHQARLE